MTPKQIHQQINPNQELLRWGPIDGLPLYPDYFNLAFLKYARQFISWPDIMGVFFKEKMIFIADYPSLIKQGAKNFRKFILNDRNFSKYYRLWKQKMDDFVSSEEKIGRLNLKNLKDAELKGLYRKFASFYIEIFNIGLIPEISGWGGEFILNNLLKTTVKSEEFSQVYEKLSAPEGLSFYQQAELDLLKLKFIKNQKRLRSALIKYQQKYFPIYNSYHGTKVLSVDYFKKELNKYSLAKAQVKVKELTDWTAKIRQQKKAIARKCHLSKSLVKIAERLAYCVWWQDRRKYYIFLTNHYIDLFLKEFSRRYQLPFKDFHYYNCHDLFTFVGQGKKLSSAEINKRKKNFVVYYSQRQNKLYYFSGPATKRITDPYLKVKIDSKIKELTGLVVSGGQKVRGQVKIIHSPREVNKMKRGNILVASMTSPDYIVALRKASAIVTDEGGMTSHAAIVSRELKIPCIVGTKIATKVLKDGDIVEVDANQGIIRKLK